RGLGRRQGAARNLPSASLLPSPLRRPDGAARARARQAHDLPVQGRRELLLRRRGRRRRLDVPAGEGRVAEGRGLRLLLRRASGGRDGARPGRDRALSRRPTRVRFAPSPTGSLHVGNALSAVANRRLGDWLLLRIDDTDAARNVPGGEEAIVADLRWLGVGWDEGPVRQSERQERYRKAAAALGGDRFGRITLLRPDGTATYHLASVVDDLDFGITHVVRGHDHAANTRVHADLFRALGAEPPEFVLHGLILGPDGKKLS